MIKYRHDLRSYMKFEATLLKFEAFISKAFTILSSSDGLLVRLKPKRAGGGGGAGRRGGLFCCVVRSAVAHFQFEILTLVGRVLI